ncbi:MAG TPA: hypothetical protein VHO47_05400 [Candidatus Babeliales bacterium]|nr:hypothetical protein [Candidatus Babeliales bacterium]
MYLVIGVDRIAARVAHYSSVVRYVLTIFLISILVTVWYFGIYLGLANTHESVIKHTTILEKTISQGYEDKKNSERLRQQSNNLRSELRDLFNSNSVQAPTKLLAILAIAEKCGLVVQSCSYQYEKEKEWCTKQGLSYTFQGKFAQIMQLLKQLDAQQFLMCKEISITRQENMLQVHCVFETIKLKESLYA